MFSLQVERLQEEITTLENELASSLDKMTDYETASLHNDHSTELAMNRDQISELQNELRNLRSSGVSSGSKVSELESQLSGALQQMEEAQGELEGKRRGVDELTDQLVESQGKVIQLEKLLEEVRANLSALETQSESSVVAEREESVRLKDELDSAIQQVAELNSEITSMHSAHETYVVSSDLKLCGFKDKLSDRDQVISELKSELSAVSSAASADKLNLEAQLEDTTNNMTRLVEQTSRDVARITDLENLVASKETDGNSQLIIAHRKISELEGVLKGREISSKDEMKAVHDTVTELRVQLSQDKQTSSDMLEQANKKCKDLQVALDQVSWSYPIYGYYIIK